MHYHNEKCCCFVWNHFCFPLSEHKSRSTELSHSLTAHDLSFDSPLFFFLIRTSFSLFHLSPLLSPTCFLQDMHIISTDEKQVFAAVQEWNQNNTYSLYISDSPGVYFTLSLENLRTSRGPAGNLLVDFYKVCTRFHSPDADNSPNSCFMYKQYKLKTIALFDRPAFNIFLNNRNHWKSANN